MLHRVATAAYIAHVSRSRGPSPLPSESEGALRIGVCAGGLGAVFRTVLETMRTLFVWLVDLLLFYTPLGLGKLGESWSAWSFLQAAG